MSPRKLAKYYYMCTPYVFFHLNPPIVISSRARVQSANTRRFSQATALVEAWRRRQLFSVRIVRRADAVCNRLHCSERRGTVQLPSFGNVSNPDKYRRIISLD